MIKLFAALAKRIKNQAISGRLGSRLTIAFIMVLALVLAAFIRDSSVSLRDEAQTIAMAKDDPMFGTDFQFIGQGKITAGSDNTWVIGGVPIRISDQTELMSDLHVGDFVTLTGRVLQEGVWLADRIELTEEKETLFTFNGPLEWVRGSIWRIAGHSLLVNLQTELGSDLRVNDILLTTFNVLENGAWLALNIAAFDKFPPTQTPTPTPTPTPKPTQPQTVKPADQPAPASKPEGKQGSTTICHRPPGNPGAAHTITVQGGGLQEHLNHGDTLGPCP